MLWIIGGIVGAIFFMIILCYIASILSFELDEFLITICTVGILVFGLYCGLCGEPQGYTEPILKYEVELVSLNNTIGSQGGGNLWYVTISSGNVYTYRYEINDKYNIGGKAYKTNTLFGNVTEIESKECTKPVLKVYEREPRKNKWISFSIDAKTKTEYVFYVPEGTIQKEIILK